MAFWLIALTCIAIPLILIFSTWEYGFSSRYCTDFAWQMLIGAYAIAFFLYLKASNTSMKRLAEKIFIFSMLFTFVVNFAQIYSLEIGGLQSVNVEASFYAFERLFEFWKQSAVIFLNQCAHNYIMLLIYN